MRLEYGQSMYTPDPGTVPDGEDVICGVCGAVCESWRDVLGPRGWAQAMAKGKSLHDRFTCPHYECVSFGGSTWHGRAEYLMREARSCKSPTLAKVYASDAARIVAEKKVIEWTPTSES